MVKSDNTGGNLSKISATNNLVGKKWTNGDSNARLFAIKYSVSGYCKANTLPTELYALLCN